MGGARREQNPPPPAEKGETSKDIQEATWGRLGQTGQVVAKETRGEKETEQKQGRMRQLWGHHEGQEASVQSAPGGPGQRGQEGPGWHIAEDEPDSAKGK